MTYRRRKRRRRVTPQAAVSWLWEFSKKVVWTVTLLYIVSFVFAMQVWVMIVAIASTLITAAAFAQYFNIAMLWYYWVAAIALGFLVCYAAMFGYDNLYKQIMETVQKIRELLAGITKDAE